MGQSCFIWNGIDCRSRGVIMRGPAPIVRAEERVKHVEIPGLAGDLTETEGENIFNSYIQTVTISVRGAYNVRNIYKGLRGAGYVTFSGEPDRKQAARVIGAITLNRGDVTCRPLWKVTVSGSGTNQSVALTAGGNAFAVTGQTGGTVIWIDSGTMEVFNTDKTELITRNSAGEFPVLLPGANTISGSGWSSIEIEKRERFL